MSGNGEHRPELHLRERNIRDLSRDGRSQSVHRASADPRVLMYVTVTATQTSYQSLMSYPGLTNPSPPPVQSVARVQ